MNEFKSMLKSKTLWGIIVSIAASISGKFGYVITDEAAWVNDIAALVSLVYAFYGRIVATKKISSVV